MALGSVRCWSELSSALSKVTKTFAYELNDPHGSGMPDAAGFEPGSMHTAEIGFLYDQPGPGKHTAEQYGTCRPDAALLGDVCS